MAITARPNFDPGIKWAAGAGCLHCRSNVSEEGAKVGIQCVDLGVEDDFLGRYGLCYDCAIQVGLAVGMMSRTQVDEKAAEAYEALRQAQAEKKEAVAAAAQARLDKDTVERLIGSVYQESNVPFGPGVA